MANHIYLGFRPHDADPYRAAGSLTLDVDLPTTTAVASSGGRSGATPPAGVTAGTSPGSRTAAAPPDRPMTGTG